MLVTYFVANQSIIIGTLIILRQLYTKFLVQIADNYICDIQIN